MNTFKRYKIPIFNYGMIVRIFDDKNDISDIPDFNNVLGRTIDFDGCSHVIIKNGASDTMVHEAEHVKNSVWKYIGYTPLRDNDEVDAYLLTYIYGKIAQAYNRHNSI